MVWSPSYDYVAEVWLPTLGRFGVEAEVQLRQSGWFPIGRGEISAGIAARGSCLIGGLDPLQVSEPGRLLRIYGRALAANLPAHVCERMAARARARLKDTGVPIEIAAANVQAACAGAGLFLTAECETCRGGVSGIGKRGKPAEVVADEAVDQLFGYCRSGAAFDRHLADQLLLPSALAAGPSRYTTETVSQHLASNAFVIEAFGLARISWKRSERGFYTVDVAPVQHGGAPWTST
jgi:RNA 3'-terminal phosphate cyclase (ATP)